MEDHDQRFKLILQSFFREFMELFFPEWAKRFDLSQPEWLREEEYLDPPQGEKVRMDLVAKLPLRESIALGRNEPDHWLALVHIEVESGERSTDIRDRMLDYYRALRKRYNLPVVPLVLFLRVGLDGIGWDAYEESVWGRRLVWFSYPYIGLPALDAMPYLTGENLLGVALAALMRVPTERRAELKVGAVERLGTSALNKAQKYLLLECVETYFPLNDNEADEYRRIIETASEREVKQMPNMWIEIGKKEGLQEGLQQGRQSERRAILLMFLEKRFGALSEQVRQRVDALDPKRVEEVLDRILTATSLRDLGLED
jgi:hypothetical protein